MRQGGGRYDDLLDFACISVPNRKLKFPRGLNSLWSNGGIQYALPIR